MNADILAAIDTCIHVTLTVDATDDAELLSKWIPLGIRKDYEPAIAKAVGRFHYPFEIRSYLGWTSRTRYVAPVYKALSDNYSEDVID